MSIQIDKKIIELVGRGVNTRYRLRMALFREQPDDVNHSVARLLYAGRLFSRGKKLYVMNDCSDDGASAAKLSARNARSTRSLVV